MELSPEERERIYLEEKARLEAREQLQQERKEPKKANRLGLKWAIVIVFGALIISSIIQEKDKPKLASKTPAQLFEEVKATKKQSDSCNAKLKKAKESDMLYDIVIRGAIVKVLVGPTYFLVPIDAKQGFATVVNCSILEGKDGGIPFDLFHWQTGKRVASWNGYRLDVE